VCAGLIANGLAPQQVRAQRPEDGILSQIVSSLELRDDSALVHRYIRPLKRASKNPNVDAGSLATAKYANALPESVLEATSQSRNNIEQTCKRHMASQVDFSRIEGMNLDDFCNPKRMEGARTPQGFTVLIGFWVGVGAVAKKMIERHMKRNDLPFTMEEALRDPAVPPYDTSLVAVYKDTSSIECKYEILGQVSQNHVKEHWSDGKKLQHARGAAGMMGGNALVKSNLVKEDTQAPDGASELVEQIAQKTKQVTDALVSSYAAVRTVHPCE
jgi:hypothetical protein